MARKVLPSAVQPTTVAAAEQMTQEAPPEAGLGRLLSLDAFRGFTMFWIVGGDLFIRGLPNLSQKPIIDAIVQQFDHSHWLGLHFWDCIWPSFLLMVGISVPISFAKRSLTQSYDEQLRHAIQRSVILFLLGSVQESLSCRKPFWKDSKSLLPGFGKSSASILSITPTKGVLSLSRSCNTSVL